MYIWVYRHIGTYIVEAWTEQRVYTHEYFSKPEPFKPKDGAMKSNGGVG